MAVMFITIHWKNGKVENKTFVPDTWNEFYLKHWKDIEKLDY